MAIANVTVNIAGIIAGLINNPASAIAPMKIIKAPAIKTKATAASLTPPITPLPFLLPNNEVAGESPFSFTEASAFSFGVADPLTKTL